jgi:hypothetical protein
MFCGPESGENDRRRFADVPTTSVAAEGRIPALKTRRSCGKRR